MKANLLQQMLELQMIRQFPGGNTRQSNSASSTDFNTILADLLEQSKPHAWEQENIPARNYATAGLQTYFSYSIPAYSAGDPTPYQELIDQAAQKFGLDAKLIHSVIKHESNYNPTAKSRAGVLGLMQLMPKTAQSLGIINAFDPQQNIEGGARYLRKMLDRYDGDVRLALAAYNAGSGNVDKYRGIPPFQETQNYVAKVMNTWQDLA